jgi:hypothetical protein
VLVEDSSFSDLTGEAVYWSQSLATPIGQTGGAVIDLGRRNAGQPRTESVRQQRRAGQSAGRRESRRHRSRGAGGRGRVGIVFASVTRACDQDSAVRGTQFLGRRSAGDLHDTGRSASDRTSFSRLEASIFAGVTDFLTVDPQP